MRIKNRYDPQMLIVRRYGEDILRSQRFRHAREIPHHLGVSVAQHSIHVAVQGVRIARWLDRRGVRTDLRDVVRVSLLHDIGMTEPRVFHAPSWMKAYTHPRAGIRIAQREFDVSGTLSDAIRHHMWPICVIPPAHLTGWIVLAADKIASVEETFSS